MFLFSISKIFSLCIKHLTTSNRNVVNLILLFINRNLFILLVFVMYYNNVKPHETLDHKSWNYCTGGLFSFDTC